VGSWSKEVKGYAYLGMLKRALNWGKRCD
jgi:hypothetical protein